MFDSSCSYRHQADACHAYQVALGNGIPADRIVTMVFDDVANNEGNPFPGQLFNTANGSDVYAGCVLDYTGMDVSMANFFKVLQGDPTATSKRKPGRVLGSTAADQVSRHSATSVHVIQCISVHVTASLACTC